MVQFEMLYHNDSNVSQMAVRRRRKCASVHRCPYCAKCIECMGFMIEGLSPVLNEFWIIDDFYRDWLFHTKYPFNSYVFSYWQQGWCLDAFQGLLTFGPHFCMKPSRFSGISAGWVQKCSNCSFFTHKLSDSFLPQVFDAFLLDSLFWFVALAKELQPWTIKALIGNMFFCIISCLLINFALRVSFKSHLNALWMNGKRTFRILQRCDNCLTCEFTILVTHNANILISCK